MAHVPETPAAYNKRYLEAQKEAGDVPVTDLMMFMHTPKAVRAGRNSGFISTPDDRVMLVVSKTTGKRKVYYSAWKCRLTRDGLVHPAFLKPLKLTVLALSKGIINGMSKGNKGMREGAEPTANFHKDSFYKQVTVLQLAQMAASMGEDPAKAKAAASKAKEKEAAMFLDTHFPELARVILKDRTSVEVAEKEQATFDAYAEYFRGPGPGGRHHIKATDNIINAALRFMIEEA